MNKNKIAVVACSNANLDYFDHPYDIRIFRSTLHFGDEDYLDGTEITPEEFYERIETDKSVFPSSSYYPLGKMIETYENLLKDGYKKVIVVAISAKMSGIVNASMMAANEVEGLEVTVFDSKTIAYPQAQMALVAAKMAEEGKDVKDIIKELEYLRDNNNIYFAVHTLTYLVRNGRLSTAQGFIGNAMKLKPLLNLGESGEVQTVEKIRTFHKAINKVLDTYFNEIEGKDVEAFIMHARNQETVDFIIAQIKEKRPDVETPFVLPLSPVIGAHCGPGTVALGYTIKK